MTRPTRQPPSVLVVLTRRSGPFPTLEIDELVIGGTRHTAVGACGELDKRSAPAAGRFCVLALQTHLVRSVRGKAIAGGPPPVPASLRRHLKPLWDSKKHGDQAWKKDVFGGDPFAGPIPYLTGSGSRSGFEIWIPEEVGIRVEVRDSSAPPDPDLLRKLIRDTVAAALVRPDKLAIALRGRAFEVSSEVGEGYLYRGALLKVIVTRTFPSRLLVFWIDSENRPTTLFSDAADLRAEFSHECLESRERTSLILPGDGEFVVSTPPGAETCLVVDSRQPFPAGAAGDIERRIGESLHLRLASIPPERPRFQRFPLPTDGRPRVLRRRLELASPPEDLWRQALLDACASVSGSLCLFDIPNR